MQTLKAQILKLRTSWWRLLVVFLIVGGLVGVGMWLEDPWYVWEERRPGSDFRRYDELIAAAAERNGVDPRLLKALVWQESRFNAAAGGAAGERGLMQVMEGAAADWVAATGVQTFQNTDLFDAKTNLEVGAWYLGRALRRHQDRDDPRPFALAEYNAGASRVQRWAGGVGAEPGELTGEAFRAAVDFPGTARYIQRILARQEFYERRGEFAEREEK